ncbi:MAG: phage integrase N-terminal SAM-like domain-containing protein [Nitrospirota bacterium]
MRLAARARHLSRHTEQAYSQWVRRFMIFHGPRPLADMAEPEIGQFLSSLASPSHVSALTNQSCKKP